MSMLLAKAQFACIDMMSKVLPMADWNLNNVLENTKTRLIDIGCLLMMVIGVVMIIVGIFKIAQALISHGKTQVNWPVNILLIVVGALFCAGSAFFKTLTDSGEESFGGALADELNNLGGGGGGE